MTHPTDRGEAMTTRTDVGASAPVVDRHDVIERERTVVAEPIERALRWGPIAAGLVTAFTTFLMLGLLATGAGFAAVDAGDTPPTVVATAVTSVVALVSFFIGGFIASWSAGATTASLGALYGFVVFSTWLVAMLVLSGLGLGSLFGEAGAMFGSVRGPELSTQEILDAISAGAFGTFLALALGGLAAALGGAVGATDRLYARR